jgi:hypothetical protein
MKHVSRVGQRNQGIDVQKVSHGKSANAARTSSFETFTSGGDFVIRNPVARSRMSLGTCPLLDNVIIMAYRLTVLRVSQT